METFSGKQRSQRFEPHGYGEALSYRNRFLDVIFNLATKKYFTFQKTNNTSLYSNAFSNDPLTIIKQLPEIINKRIWDLPCNKEEFDKVKSVYKSALKDSGHFSAMQYSKRSKK